MTSISYTYYHYMALVYRYVLRIHHYVVLIYSISYSWGNKESLTTISFCLYTSHSGSISTITASPPCMNIKSVKASFTCDVQKNTILGVGSHVNKALSFPHALFATQPHPSFCSSVHHS